MFHKHYLTAAFFTGIFLSGNAGAQNRGSATSAVVLTDAGKSLASHYASIQKTLKEEIEKAIPKVEEAKIAAWLQAIEAEEVIENEYMAKEKERQKWQGAAANLRKLEESLKYAPQTLEDAQAELTRARERGQEDPEKMKLLQSAESFLKSRQTDIDKINAGIEKAKKEVEEAKIKLPDSIKAVEVAKQAYDKALANTWKAMDALGVGAVLSSSALDARLAQYVILTEATPDGLAEFAQQNPQNQKLLESLLSDKDLMLQMLVNDGAEKGKYGQAMKIYTDIQKASSKANSGIYQRLAMACSLAHAVPIFRRIHDLGHSTPKDAPVSAYIDPVQRYLSYETWYDAGELHKGFKNLSVWNLRRVVDCTDPDEILAWGRQMLHSLRPDCIPDDDDTLVFVDVVDKEIQYTSANVKDDLPDKQFMQNILANGGICGRRGFFGRFILQAFGVPSTERVEPGHSTITLWHPTGWQTRLGGNFGKSSFGYYSKMGLGGGSYGADVNFVSSSLARENESAFIKVKRAQWIGTAMGETWKPGLITYSGKTRGPAPTKPGEAVKSSTWSDIALHEQRRIIAQCEAKNPRAPASFPFKKEPTATGIVTTDSSGAIAIPASATSNPVRSKRSLYKGGQSDLIVFFNNKNGETLLHLSRYAKEGDSFEYTFDSPRAGTYQLVADIATPKPNQKLYATINGGNTVEMALPYTIGLWGKTQVVDIELKAGSNVLKFHGPARATFKQFTLTPVK